MSQFEETHLGDGVYVVFDGWQCWLDCRGQSQLSVGPTGRPGIALEPAVLDALNAFHKRVTTQVYTSGTADDE